VPVTALVPVVVLAAMTAFAILALLFGPDGRPGVDQRPEGWVGSRS
jgi:hypothetical protein